MSDPAPPPDRRDPTRGPDGLDPVVGPGAAAVPTPPDDDLAVVAAELDRAEPTRLATGVRAVGTAAVATCVLAAATSLGSALLVRWAWPDDRGALVIAAALVGIGAGVPIFIAVRVRRLADALGHPGEVLDQARDLVARAKGSPELGRLAMGLRGRGSARRARRRTGRVGRIRRTVASGRTISAVIGLADPDPVRHRHLVAFTPVRLRSLWLAVTVALWTWLAALAIGAVALGSLLVGLL